MAWTKCKKCGKESFKKGFDFNCDYCEEQIRELGISKAEIIGVCVGFTTGAVVSLLLNAGVPIGIANLFFWTAAGWIAGKLFRHAP